MKYVSSLSFIILGLTVLIAIGFLFPQSSEAQGNANTLHRYAANHRTFCGPNFVGPCELLTSTAPSGTPPGSGGSVIYDKTFFVDGSINTIYVTMGATGDVHDGARSLFSASLNGSACNPGGNPVGLAPPGWVTLKRHFDLNNFYFGATGVFIPGDGGGGGSDMHDNSIYYTWCCPLDAPNNQRTHNVTVSMACLDSSGATCQTGLGGTVFIEGVYFFVDGNKIKESNRCTDFDEEIN